MRNRTPHWSRFLRACAVVALTVTAGCASAPQPVVNQVISPPAAPPIAAEPPVPTPAPAPRSSTLERTDVVLLVDGSAASHAQIAATIAATLPPRRYRVTRITADSDDMEALTTLRRSAATVIAVGRAAVDTAQRELPNVPIVFCQMLRHEDLTNAGGFLWGIAAWPSPGVSLAAWRAIDPRLRTVMLIVSDPESALAASARTAAAAQGIDLHIEQSSSDRETLYLFRRFAAAIDGLWLLPDDKVFGPTTLRELLGYAGARGVGVLAFNEALLQRGALLSATSVPADVAASVHALVERVVAGRTVGIPSLSPLSAAELTVNPTVAAALGLPPRIATRWVAREDD
jgi:hypothetical protein